MSVFATYTYWAIGRGGVNILDKRSRNIETLDASRTARSTNMPQCGAFTDSTEEPTSDTASRT